MGKKPNIKDIAKAAGLSTAAVSYALTGKGRVSAQTQEIVKRIADKIGFIRDDTAARLRTGESNLMGAIVHDISNPFFAELLSDFEAFAYEAGYLTIVANAKDDPARQAALIDAMLAQGVAGLLISPVNGTEATGMQSLQLRGKPYVVCVRDVGDERADYVGLNDWRAGYLAASHLLDAGIRHFAFVGGLDHTKTWRGRLDGIRAAVAESGAIFPDTMIFTSAPTREAGSQTMAHVLETQSGCSAAICINDYVALGAYAAIHSSGGVVGQSYSVVGFDNVPQSASLLPPLTTVEMFPRDIGRKSAALLLGRLKNPKRRLERLLVEPELIARHSVVKPMMVS
jgi:LacI family transcriptional regulator